MGRKFLAVLAGIVTCLSFVALIESAGHMLYAPGSMPETHDAKAIAAFVAALPAEVFLSILLAYAAGTFVGGWTACRIAGEKPRLYAGIVGGLMLLGAAANFLAMPHPTWLVAASLIAIAAAAFLASLAGRPRIPAGQ